MNICITGANGKVARAIIPGLSEDGHGLILTDVFGGAGFYGIDLAEEQQHVRPYLAEMLECADVLIHLASDGRERTTGNESALDDPIKRRAHFANIRMHENVFSAARDARTKPHSKLKRILFGSSFLVPLGHILPRLPSDNEELPHEALHPERKILVTDGPAPACDYGITKANFEVRGFDLARRHGFEFIAVRFGNVYDNDIPVPGDPFYLSKRDCLQLIKCCLAVDLSDLRVPHEICTGTSANACCPFSLFRERSPNRLNYQPQDGTRCPFGMA